MKTNLNVKDPAGRMHLLWRLQRKRCALKLERMGAGTEHPVRETKVNTNTVL
jgi:hypothetical protein